MVDLKLLKVKAIIAYHCKTHALNWLLGIQHLGNIDITTVFAYLKPVS